MKALSLHQPYASAVALGLKQLETRGLKWRYLGPVAIHAAKTDNWLIRSKWLSLCLAFPEIRNAFGDYLNGDIRFEALPFGAIVATARITCCGDVDFFKPDPVERALGDYSPERWVMCLNDVKRLPEPIAFKGRQGWFEVPDSLLA